MRSAKPDTFYVLKNTKVPAVLIELGFLSNFGEEQKLADAAYQQLLARELVESILKYVDQL